MAQPIKSKSKTKVPAKKAVAKASAPTAEKLHYNKTALLADYSSTYSMFMKTLAIGIGGALVYFFILAVYLGGWGHTKSDDYVRAFGTRIDYGYSGLRLPEFDDPSLVQDKK